MSSKIEISRELAEYAAALLDQNCPGNVANELRALLAAPVVERQPLAHSMKSVAEAVDASRCYTVLTSNQCWALAQSLNNQAIRVAPPELAELQATIARLTAENERLTSEPVLSALAKMLTEARMKIVDRDLEIERLKGGRGEAVAWFTEDHLTDKSATTYDVGVSVMWAVKGWPVTPLYTSQPAPVAVVLPERKDAIYVIGSAYDDGLCEGWNACLDKVKELNKQ